MKKFLASIFIAAASVPAQGQENEMPDTVKNYLSEIIVSANRWEQSLGQVPNKVSTVNTALIKFQNPQTSADLLGASNNVFIQKSQLGGGSPMIRGFSTNRVMLAVDGIRMNTAIFRSGNVQNVISLDPNSVQEVTIVFGPGAVMYGSDAIGGVMDFQTLRPGFSENEDLIFKSNALVRYSSANKERTVHADFTIGSKKWSFLTSITRSIYDDLRMGSNGPVAYTRPDYVERQSGQDINVINTSPNVQAETGYDQWNALQKISFQPNSFTNVTYGFHYSRTSDCPRYDRLILKENNEFANAEWYYGPQKWLLHTLNFRYSKSTSLFDKAKFILGFQDYEESRHNRAFGSLRKTNRTEKVKAFSTNLDLDKKIGDRLTFYYGAEFVVNKVYSSATRQHIDNGEVAPASTRYPDGSTWRSLAGYVSLKINPHPKWSINLSDRFTSVYMHAEYDRTFFNFPFTETTLRNQSMNGSLGLIFSPTSFLKLYSNLSSGFRAPNVDDIGKVFDSQPGNVVVPNPNLKPERAYNAEIGFVTFLGDALNLDIATYYTIMNNAIARGASTFNGQDSIEYDGVLSRVLSQQNISKVWVGGIQAELSWQIAADLKVSSTINIQKGKEKDLETNRNFSPTHVAPMFGATHLTYTKRKIKADLYANYNGSISHDNLALTERADEHLYAKDGLGNPYSPGWWTLNAKVEFKVFKYVVFSTGIENILDKRYRPYASGISAPGRNLILAVRASF